MYCKHYPVRQVYQHPWIYLTFKFKFSLFKNICRLHMSGPFIPVDVGSSRRLWLQSQNLSPSQSSEHRRTIRWAKTQKEKKKVIIMQLGGAQEGCLVAAKYFACSNSNLCIFYDCRHFSLSRHVRQRNMLDSITPCPLHTSALFSLMASLGAISNRYMLVNGDMHVFLTD